jgi:hypothetical protein
MIIPSKSDRHVEISNASTKSRGNSSRIEQIPTQTGMKKRGNIRFHDIVTVQETIHINDLSYDEIENSWYSKREYKQIKEGVSAIVAAVQSGTYEGDTDKDCLHGLECRLKKNSLRRKKVILYGIMVVLGVQEEQDITGKYDARIIAQAYKSVSLQCLALSHKMGLIHEAEVNDYQLRMKNDKTIKNDISIRQIILSRIIRREKRRENIN